MTLNELQKELGMEARQTGVFVSALASNGLLQVTKIEEASEDLFATLLYLKSFWTSQRNLAWAISLKRSTIISTRHGIILLNLFRHTNKPLNAADGGGAGSIFDQDRNRQSNRFKNLHMPCMA